VLINPVVNGAQPLSGVMTKLAFGGEIIRIQLIAVLLHPFKPVALN
jgi:hypothetical protein